MLEIESSCFRIDSFFTLIYFYIYQDWPPSTDFQSAFPELYADFSQAVPVPDFVRRDGVYNIASHFPTNSIGPDLGESSQNVKNTSSNMYMNFYRS